MGDLTFSQAIDVVNSIQYKEGWNFQISQNAENEFVLQLCIPVVDVLTKEHRLAFGRKWIIPFKQEGDILRTALMAVLTMEEHEARELFKYKGAAIYGPHQEISRLLDAVLYS